MFSRILHYSGLIAAVILLTPSDLLGGDGDTIFIKYEELSFTCEDEKASLINDFTDPATFIETVLALECRKGIADNALSRINEIVEVYVKKLASPKANRAKLIKEIYSEVHKSLLSTYETNIPFHSIFREGKYNCLTASILYAYVFDRLGISYTIRETPSHVYLIAEPSTLSLVIETTAPGSSFIQYDGKFITEYVNYLTENKLVSKEDLASKDKTTIFNEHFFSSESISKQQLVSNLYYNAAVKALDESDLSGALLNFEKANFLYPNLRNSYFIQATLNDIVLLNENKKTRDLDAILKMLKLSNATNLNVFVKAVYAEITADLVEKRPDLKLYRAQSMEIFSAVKDEELLLDLKYQYLHAAGMYYYFSKNLDSAKVYFNEFLQLFPDNAKIRSLFNTIVMNELDEMFEEMDEEDAIDSLLSWTNQYPFLFGETGFVGLLVEIVEEEVEYIYDEEGFAGIDNMIQEIVTFARSRNRLHELEPVVAAIFSLAQRQAIMKSNYKLARQYLNMGLEIYPDNEDLKYKLQLIADMGK